MKILWIEDFGEGLSPDKIALEMYKGLIPEDVFDEEYDSDEEIESQLPSLFQKHTPHQIVICKSYQQWKEIDQQENKDFDLIFIIFSLCFSSF